MTFNSLGNAVFPVTSRGLRCPLLVSWRMRLVSTLRVQDQWRNIWLGGYESKAY